MFAQLRPAGHAAPAAGLRSAREFLDLALSPRRNARLEPGPDRPGDAGGPTPYRPAGRAEAARATARRATSRRRMSRGRRAWYAFLVLMIRGVMRLTWGTCRIGPVIGEAHLDRLFAAGQPAILAYWHQMQLILGPYLLRRCARGDPIGFLISPSVSGEVPTAIVERWGARVLRGSSTRAGGAVIRDLHGLIARERVSPVLTPDGPKGPLHEFKTGALLLARITRAPIVPMAFAARPCTFWNSWDRFVVPWPFARVAIAIGEPVHVGRDTPLDDLAPVQRRLEAALAEAEAAARAALAG